MRIAPEKESFLSQAIKQLCGDGGRRKEARDTDKIWEVSSRSGTSLYRVSIALLHARRKVGRR